MNLELSSPRKTDGTWHEVTLGEVAHLNEETYSPKEAWPFVNYLETGSITENRIAEIQKLEKGKNKIPSRARRKVQPGDIVYSTVRPNQRHFGLLKSIPENFLASTGFAVLRGKEGITDTGFLYWFLAQDHIIEYLHSIAENSTSAYPSIRPSELERLTFSLPPLPEQRAIAHILGTLDDKIDLNRRMNQTLEEMTHAIYKDWFVDFGPVRAKIEGLEPYLPPDLWDLFPDLLVDSELGEIPAGWQVGEMQDAVTILDHLRIPLNSRQRAQRKGIYRYYGAAGILDHVDDFLFEGVHVLTGEDGSVVDPNGHPVTQYVWGQFWVNNHAHVLKGKMGYCDEHIYLLMQTQEIRAFVTGAVQPKLNQNNLKSIPILVPSTDLLEAFPKTIQPMFGAIRSNSDETFMLTTQRDTLLPKLISGELRAEGS